MNYVQVEVPNILFEYEDGTEAPLVTLHTFMAPLLLRIAKRHASWKIIVTKANYTDYHTNTRVAYAFSVFHGDEKLGALYVAHYDSGAAYIIDTPRLNNKSVRGAPSRTRDVDKAVRLVDKWFQPKNAHERMQEAVGECQTIMHLLTNEARSSVNSALNRMLPMLSNFAQANWDEFISVNSGDSVAATLPGKQEILTNVEKLHRLLSKNKGSVVMIRNSDYMVLDWGADPRPECVSFLTHDTLSEHFRRSIGLLKLAAVKTVVPDVGVRVWEHTFIVLHKGAE